MATQWTAGLTDNTVLPASTLNQIGATPESYTPTLGATSGTITTAVINRANYFRLQKMIFGYIDISITTAGTAAGAFLTFTLPLTAAYTPRAIGIAREVNSTGNICTVDAVNTTTCYVLTYNNGGTVGTGYRYVGTYRYEVA